MKERFEGPRGKELLVEALKEQRVVRHDHEIASRLADLVHLKTCVAGDVLVAQGASDNSLLFIISGEASIAVNGRQVAVRSAGESVGEMALASPDAPRSATVTAVKTTLVATLSEGHFAEIAESSPRIWKALARVISDRLRQREKFHRVANPMPIVFVGSSVEGLPVARAIVEGFMFDKVLTHLWSTPGVFSAGDITAEALLREVDVADFAVLVFGKDDKISSRNIEYAGPRDNVIFELGLFMGRLGPRRALVVKEHTTDIKIPTDLLGVTVITYLIKLGQDLTSAVEPICSQLRRTIDELGTL